jgi:hypothetical protein
VQAANEALRFLHNVNEIVGPLNADFATVFTFKPSPSTSRRRVPKRGNTDSGSSSEEEDTYILNSPFAHERSVFAQNSDFWDVVGWAFNCSIVWKKRWSRWNLWLDLVLNILDADWEERWRQAEELKDMKPLEESMVFRFLESADNRTGRRRILRAILADGERKSLSEFGEVWKDETKERKIKEKNEMGPVKKIDLDADEWADYDYDVDEDETVEEEVKVKTNNDDFGGADSMQLRQRFLLLVSNCLHFYMIWLILAPAR